MTTTTSALTTEIADAEQQAAEAAARVEAKRAELERQRAEEQARREAAEHAWWEARAERFAPDFRGSHDALWQAFVAAVRDGGDTVAAYRDYRSAVVRVRDELMATTRYFDEREDAKIRARREEYKRLATEAIRLDGTRGKWAEWPAWLAAWRKAAVSYVGRELTDGEIGRYHGHLHEALPEPPKLSTRSYPAANDPRLGAQPSYAAAVDLVVRQIEHEAVAGLHRERDESLAEACDAAANGPKRKR